MRVFMTGGAGGIGGAIRERFLKAGAEVIAPGSQELDLRNPASVGSYFTKNPGTLAGIDVFIHAAGFNEPKWLKDVSADELEKSFNANALAFVTLTQKLIPSLSRNKNGKVLAISSLYGSMSRERRLVYTMAKHALEGAVKTLALELGREGVIVNAISPGFIDTALTRKNNSPEMIQQLSDRTALRRLGKPEDIAEVAWFLCSEQNRYLTGQSIIVDGGYSIGAFQTG